MLLALPAGCTAHLGSQPFGKLVPGKLFWVAYWPCWLGAWLQTLPATIRSGLLIALWAHVYRIHENFLQAALSTCDHWELCLALLSMLPGSGRHNLPLITSTLRLSSKWRRSLSMLGQSPKKPDLPMLSKSKTATSRKARQSRLSSASVRGSGCRVSELPR